MPTVITILLSMFFILNFIMTLQKKDANYFISTLLNIFATAMIGFGYTLIMKTSDLWFRTMTDLATYPFLIFMIIAQIWMITQTILKKGENK